ncbi:MAG: hypothetical protein J2P18_15845 [Nocardia sp.]|nr:hypothetical protein [Nocardia sp.]
MTTAAGVAHASPAPTTPVGPADAAPGIDYRTALVGKTVVTTLKGGTFQLVDKHAPGSDPRQVLDVKDPSGRIALEMPMDFRISGTRIPVKSVVEQNSSVLKVTPDKPVGVDLRAPVAAAKDIASPVEDQRAMEDFATKFGLATAIGGFVGTAIGAAIGCVVTIVAGCLPGLLTGAGVGAIVGTVIAGGPTLAAAGIDLVQTVQARNGTTRWSDAAMAAAQAPANQRPPGQRPVK